MNDGCKTNISTHCVELRAWNFLYWHFALIKIRFLGRFIAASLKSQCLRAVAALHYAEEGGYNALNIATLIDS